MPAGVLWPVVVVVLGGCRSEPVRSDPVDPVSSQSVEASGEAGTPAAPVVEEPVIRSALTLDQALATAMQEDPRLEEARARIRALQARGREVGLFPDPELILRAESAAFEGSTFDEAEYLVGLSQPLPLGDRRDRAVEVASREADQVEQELRAGTLRVRRDVQGAFAAALYAQEAAGRRDALLEVAQEELAIARNRVASGDLVATEVLPRELSVVEARKEQQRAGAFRDRALLALAAAMSRPDLVIDSVEGDLSTSFELPSLQALVEDLATHPELAAASLRTEAARAEIELREAERIPDVHLELLYRRIESSDTNAFDVGAVIPLRLFNDGSAAVEAARSRLDVARAGQRRTLQDTEVTLRRAYQDVEQALAMLSLIQEEVLPRLRAQRDQAEARHRLGDISLEELLPVRRAALLQELGELEARREVVVAWAELSPFVAAR